MSFSTHAPFAQWHATSGPTSLAMVPFRSSPGLQAVNYDAEFVDGTAKSGWIGWTVLASLHKERRLVMGFTWSAGPPSATAQTTMSAVFVCEVRVN